MKPESLNATLLLACALAGSSSMAVGQVLFSENFEVDPTANWTVNTLGPGLSDANFFFDYSSVGIPTAPRSAGGTSRGLRLRANQFGSVSPTFPAGISVSPTGQSFAGDYQVRFDIWWNFNGPAPGGGSGSTQVSGGGIGTAGTASQIAGGTIDSLIFGATGEGGSGVDYRVYGPGAQGGFLEADGVFAAGNVAGVRNNSHAYYAGIGGATPPAAQTALFPQQTGATAAGAPGFAWHDFLITKAGDTTTWMLNGLTIASVTSAQAGTLGGGNILLNQFDINGTVSAEEASTSLLFGLIDNVQVTVIPEPSAALLALAGLGILVRRRPFQKAS